MGTELDQAEIYARRALAQKPEDGFILDTVGWVLFKKGDAQGALRFLEMAIAKQAGEAVIADHLGDVYYHLQLVGRALEMYRLAVNAESDIAKAKRIREKIIRISSQQGPSLRQPASASSAPEKQK